MANSTKTRKSRKPLQPAKGSCRWVVQPSLTGKPGVLSITSELDSGNVTEAYSLTEFKADGVLLGYHLTKADGTAYDIQPGKEVWECDCLDYIYNRARARTAELRECKHCKAVRKALAKLS